MGANGTLVTLLPATTVTADTRVNGTPELALDKFRTGNIMLTVAAKTMDASTTLDVYLQYSPDEGTTWDDLAHFAQITNAAIGNGTYVMVLNPWAIGAGVVDRATQDVSLAANTIQDIPWCDRIRVVLVPVNFSGTDTITVTVTGYFVK